jgi:hypothetical protein
MVPQPKGDGGGVSKRLKIVIVVLLLIILVPSVVVSVPTAKIVITFRNLDTTYTATVNCHVYNAGDGSLSTVVQPNGEKTVQFSVGPGRHQVYIYYSFPNESYYYGHTISQSFELWPFETEEASYNLGPTY